MAAARSQARTGSGLYSHVVDVIGQQIIDGDHPAGSILLADQLCEELSVSRSVIREAIRTLSSMGLVEARPQVGTRVLPRSSWDLLNPHVVNWREQGPGYLEQMGQLLELRLGLEHTAAGLAAQRINAEEAATILQRAHEMRQALAAHDARSFFVADADFHRRFLEGTQNEIIGQLADTVGATLNARSRDNRPGMHDLSEEAVDLHVKLAEALVARDVSNAQAFALRLVQLTLTDFERDHAGVLPKSRPAP